jgi:hypothetical protein
MKVHGSLLVPLVVLAIAVGVYIDVPGWQALGAQNSQAIAPEVSTVSPGLPDGIPSAGSLLLHAVYDTQVKTYGRVSGLGEMSCPCFSVTSDGERLEVWYDLTAQEPAAELPAIQNGDWVVVTGQLKPGMLGLGSRTFWANHIERLLEP